MKGSNKQHAQSSDLSSAYALVAELRNPMLEVLLESERTGTRSQYVVAKNAIKLLDGFLYAQELAAKNQLEMFPCSLGALAKDAVESIRPLASLYGIKFRFRSAKGLGLVSLDRQAFMHGTHGLLYTVINTLQNKPCNVDIVVEMRDGTPLIRVFADQLDIIEQDLKTGKGLRTKINTKASGSQTGIVLAGMLYEMMGEGLTFNSNQYGKGFTASFQPTLQTSLIDVLK